VFGLGEVYVLMMLADVETEGEAVELELGLEVALGI